MSDEHPSPCPDDEDRVTAHAYLDCEWGRWLPHLKAGASVPGPHSANLLKVVTFVAGGVIVVATLGTYLFGVPLAVVLLAVVIEVIGGAYLLTHLR